MWKAGLCFTHFKRAQGRRTTMTEGSSAASSSLMAGHVGGKCKLTADGESANGKWTLDGTKFHVEGGGIECDGTLENGVMSIDYDGVVFNLINEAYAAPAAQAPAPALR